MAKVLETLQQVDRIRLFHELCTIVQSGEYDPNFYWRQSNTKPQGEMCPLMHVMRHHLAGFEMQGCYFVEEYSRTATKSRHNSTEIKYWAPWQLAYKVFTPKFCRKFINFIDDGKPQEAISLIHAEINRIEAKSCTKASAIG